MVCVSVPFFEHAYTCISIVVVVVYLKDCLQTNYGDVVRKFFDVIFVSQV